MPKRDDFERRLAITADQARKADDLFAPDRVALVRHRRRTFLALRKRLLDFADLGLLKAANFEREFFQRGGGDCQRRKKLGMTIALNHLRGDRRGRQSEPPADVSF